MRTHSRHTGRNGRAFATVVVTTSQRISIHIAINQHHRHATTYALTIGQVQGAIEVLGAALADSTVDRIGATFKRHDAENGRARARLHRDYEGSLIWLTVILGSDRFLNLPLEIPDAEGIFSCGAAALRDALDLARSLNLETAR